MLQQDEPDDYVVATRKIHPLGEFLDSAFQHIGITDWEKYVGQDERYMRPADVFYLAGDAAKAKDVLGWQPKTTFEELVSKMVSSDITRLSE